MLAGRVQPARREAREERRLLGDHRILHPAGEVHFVLERAALDGLLLKIPALDRDARLVGKQAQQGASVSVKLPEILLMACKTPTGLPSQSTIGAASRSRVRNPAGDRARH